MKKRSKRILSALTVCLFISLNLSTTILAQPISNDEIATNEEISINEEFFPDENFLNYIKTSNFDLNQDGKLNQEEIKKVTYIYVNMKQINSLKGIEYFKNLKYLYAEMNYIETLDISKNTNLVGVYCSNNKLTSIKLPNQEENNTLERLEIFANSLTELDLHNLKALKVLWVNDNKLTNLDLSDNPLDEGNWVIASDNFMEKIILPNNGKDYEWKTSLASQLYPRDKSVGYKVQWYLNEEKTQILDPNTTPIIKCLGQTLYAEYVPITYTIQFRPGSGTGEIKTQQFKYDISQKLLKNEFTKSDYQFAGWKDSKGKIYEDEAEIINLTSTEGKTIELTAMWKEKDYTGEKYTINLYDGESLVKSIEGTYGSGIEIPKNELEKEGFDFLGWNYGNGDYSIYSDGGRILITHPDQLNEDGAFNLYSVWKKKEFIVNFIDGQNSSKEVIQYNDKVNFPESPTKVGYTFEGWVTDSGEEWNEQKSITANIDLYAKYAPIKYYISFDGNGADNDEAMINTKLEMNYSKQAVLPKNEYKKKFYTLEGWSTSQNGNVEFVDNDVVYELTTENNKNVTLYAVWKRNDSTITITDESLDKIYDGNIVSNPSVEKTGSVNEVVFTWYQMIDSQWKELESAPTNVGRYKVVARVAEDDNYNGASDELYFEIEKAIPTYTVPTGLNAIYGSTLNDIKLPNGFTWKENSSTYVGNAGVNTFKLIYTPEDTVNYEVIEDIEVKVNVVQATNQWIIEPSIKGWLHGVENNEPIAESAFGEVVFMYSNTKNGTYTNTIPTEVGKWYMKATVEGNENYTGLEKIVSFVIEKSEVAVNDISISNGNTETNNFKYGDKIVIKVKVEFVPESIISKLREKILGDRKVALFANGTQVTEPQVAVSGEELTFVYDTTKGLINPTGEILLTVEYIGNADAGKAIANLKITLDKKDVESEDIKVPEINEDVNLDNLEIKDGDTVLKLGVDYDITTTQNGDTVNVMIIFKGNYSGTITKTYKLENKDQSSEINKPEIDSEIDSNKENTTVTDSTNSNSNSNEGNTSVTDSTNSNANSNEVNTPLINITNSDIDSNKENTSVTYSKDRNLNSDKGSTSETDKTNSNIDSKEEHKSVANGIEAEESTNIVLWGGIIALVAGILAFIIGKKVKRN